MDIRIHLVVTTEEYTLMCFSDRRGCHFEVLNRMGFIHHGDRIFPNPTAAEWGGREWIRANSRS
ncbi:MAG: hypothetical protein AAF974_08875 [Cyanobacteria bacterium P01_E01_bin.34]